MREEYIWFLVYFFEIMSFGFNGVILNFCDIKLPASSDFNKTGGLGSAYLRHTAIRREWNINEKLAVFLHTFQHICVSKSAVINKTSH